MTILAVCMDSGGTNNMLPVVRLLRKRHEIELIPNGLSIELLTRMEEELVEYASAEAVMAANPDPTLLITSMCVPGGIGRDLVPLLRDKCPIVALQDTWGGNTLRGSWADPQYRPDYVCVNDWLNRKLVGEAWSDFPRENIVITGFPRFDRYAGFDSKKAEIEVRSAFRISHEQPIVLHAGEFDHSAYALSQVVNILSSAFARNIILIPRMHPGMPTGAPEEIPLWEAALQGFGSATLIRDSSAFSTLQVTAAATVITSMASSVLDEAGLLRKPNISIFNARIQEAYRGWVNGLTVEPPTVTLGCTAKATTPGGLIDLLEQVLVEKSLGLETAQHEYLRADGKNAQRVVGLVETLLP